ncbi:helix-turn-helix domain-containing protein [Mesorhizobium sp. CGMCC 1.15528]|uniref:Helix-turn-helix domain-containing protein n=1 Tax=Mesorhizobium zhangyense TaxID=1776730 RepID=A0A7C9VA33_9HYPH|nr:helix-turn-helix domain-containing protein [Mesorhizobium zhangyense]NGN43623.1 helix-turn-helix domain-containing protein [Mesorhizobium zhangyense]
MYQESALRSYNEHVIENLQLRHAVYFTTLVFPDHNQFDAFRSSYQGVMDISSVSGEPERFPAIQMVWDLGRMVFTRTKLPGKGYTHRRRHLSKRVLDHWYINLPFNSLEPDGQRLGAKAMPELHCLATSLETEVNDDGMLMLFFPHDLFTSTVMLDRMLDVQLDGGLGRLLADYLFLLDRSLPQLQAEEVPHVVEATRSLVAVCLAPSRDRLAEAQGPIDATLMGRARRLIDVKLANPNLTSEILCADLGVSRSRLYRLFEPLGGVASYIRRQRLLRIRAALADSMDGRSIFRIAGQWGFVDASAFSRTFRHEFGISPKEARDIGWASDGFDVVQDCLDRSETPQTLGQVLRVLAA